MKNVVEEISLNEIEKNEKNRHLPAIGWIGNSAALNPCFSNRPFTVEQLFNELEAVAPSALCTSVGVVDDIARFWADITMAIHICEMIKIAGSRWNQWPFILNRFVSVVISPFILFELLLLQSPFVVSAFSFCLKWKMIDSRVSR